MDVNYDKITKDISEKKSLEELMTVLMTGANDYNIALNELIKESKLNSSIKELLSKIGVSESDFDEGIESLVKQENTQENNEIKEEYKELKKDNEIIADETFKKQEDRFVKMANFDQKGNISELFNAIDKQDKKTMKKYSKEDLENLYVYMSDNQKELFKTELKGRRLKTSVFSKVKLNEEYFSELDALSEAFDEFLERNKDAISIEEIEAQKVTLGAKRLLPTEPEAGSDEEAENLLFETYNNQIEARDESYKELFNPEIGYAQKATKIYNKDGQKIAKKTPFGTYCNKNASTDDVYASFVSHVNRKRYKVGFGKKLHTFTIQLPEDDKNATAIVEKVLVKMVEEGLVGYDQLKVPSPYDKMLKNRLDEIKKNSFGIEDGIKETPERAVEHDAKLENGGESEYKSENIQSPEPEDDKNDDLSNALSGLGNSKEKKDEVIKKIQELEGYTESKSKDLLLAYESSADQDVLDKLIEEGDIEKIAKAVKEEYSKSQKSIVNEILENPSLILDDHSKQEVKKSMFESAGKEKEDKIFTKEDYQNAFDYYFESKKEKNVQDYSENSMENYPEPPEYDIPTMNESDSHVFDDAPSFDQPPLSSYDLQDFDVEDFDPSFNIADFENVNENTNKKSQKRNNKIKR